MNSPTGHRPLAVDQAYLEDSEHIGDGFQNAILVYANWRNLSPRTHDRGRLVDNDEFGQNWSIEKSSMGTSLFVTGIKKSYWPLTPSFELKQGELKSEMPGWKKYCAVPDCEEWYFVPTDRLHSDIDKIECDARPFKPRFAACTETFRVSGTIVEMAIPRGAIARFQEFTQRGTTLVRGFIQRGSTCSKSRREPS